MQRRLLLFGLPGALASARAWGEALQLSPAQLQPHSGAGAAGSPLRPDGELKDLAAALRDGESCSMGGSSASSISTRGHPRAARMAQQKFPQKHQKQLTLLKPRSQPLLSLRKSGRPASGCSRHS